MIDEYCEHSFQSHWLHTNLHTHIIAVCTYKKKLRSQMRDRQCAMGFITFNWRFAAFYCFYRFQIAFCLFIDVLSALFRLVLIESVRFAGCWLCCLFHTSICAIELFYIPFALYLVHLGVHLSNRIT